MPSEFIFWPCFAGALFLVVGLFAIRRELAGVPGLDKLTVLGRIFFAAPLAVFGAEHLSGPQILMRVVPPWMPARLFWAYLVGFALVAAALSIIFLTQVRLSGTLLGVMFILFVAMIHVPNVVANPRSRFLWTIVFRELAFAGGAWALAGTEIKGPNWLITFARVFIGTTAMFFGVEHFLHPEFAPGVPLPKVTPTWVPFRAALGYFTGAALVASGAAILINKHPRAAAIWLGLLIALLVVFLYSPLLAVARKPAEINEGLNYVADTLLFSGAILVLARALPGGRAAR